MCIDSLVLFACSRVGGEATMQEFNILAKKHPYCDSTLIKNRLYFFQFIFYSLSEITFCSFHFLFLRFFIKFRLSATALLEQ